VKEHAEGTPIILVGTKLDLREKESAVATLRESGQEPVSPAQGKVSGKSNNRISLRSWHVSPRDAFSATKIHENSLSVEVRNGCLCGCRLLPHKLAL
jgi:hypothetical protein